MHQSVTFFIFSFLKKLFILLKNSFIVIYPFSIKSITQIYIFLLMKHFNKNSIPLLYCQ